MQPQLLLSAIFSYVVTVFLVAMLMIAGTDRAFPAGADSREAVAPPWQYDYPFTGELTVIYLPSIELVDRVCRMGSRGVKDVPLGYYTRACALLQNNGLNCEIIMPHKRLYTEKAWNSIMRHEIGHCNGWPGDHPK